MENFWNHIHYSIYLFECNATLFFGKIVNFIFYPITNIKFLREGLEKRGSSFEEIDKVSTKIANNPKYGKSITFAGIQMGGILVIIEYCLFNFVQAILGKSLIQYVWEDSLNKLIFAVIFLAIPGVINHKLLWQDDKYLTYFKKFKKESKGIKRKWGWITFGVVVGVILLYIFSFWTMSLTLQK